MDAASDKELIPVTIELISEMNNDEIEATALQKSNLTKEKMHKSIMNLKRNETVRIGLA